VATTAAAAGVPVQAARPGSGYRLGEVSLSVVSPPYELVGTRSDPNNNSLVILALVRGVRILLPGDAEVELQRALLEQPGAAALRAHILKVPHHGSAYQEPAFLDAVAPRVALVSVGPDNSYGHPHPAPLARLAGGGARVLRTDLDGDLAAVLRGGELAVLSRGPPPGPGG
jgi:competence protein ComEC